MGVHSPILCCEGNIRGHTSWVCIHPYSVVKATSVAICRGYALTHTLMKAIMYSLLSAVKPGTVSVKWGGAVTTHRSIQTPVVGNPLEDRKDPYAPTHQTESCPLTLIWLLSCLLDLCHYRCIGHSFLFVSWGRGMGGVSSYIFLSSLPF